MKYDGMDFDFWIIKLSRKEYDSRDPNKLVYEKARYYEKPTFVDEPSKAKHFKTQKSAEKVAATYRHIGYKTAVLRYHAVLQYGEI